MNRFLPSALLLAAVATASADPKADAQAHVATAMKAHGEGKFDVALTELEAAYALDPQPDYLFAIGQVHVKLGHCDKAIEAYEKFQIATTDADAKKVTQQAIDACKSELAKSAPPPTTPPPTTPQPETPPAGAVTRPATVEPFYKDKIGDILVGAGIGAGIIGLVVYITARGELDDAESAPNIVDYRDHVDAAHDKRTLSVVFGVGGALLVAGGLVHWKLHGDRQERAQVSLGVAPSNDGGLVTLGGRF